MATEIERDGMLFVKPEVGKWPLKEHERRLYSQSDSVPNWRLADKCRRLLADTSAHLSAKAPSAVGLSLADFEPGAAREFAVTSGAAIAVRSAGSILVQVGSGYVVEAGGSLRRLIEAKLHCTAILDDRSGKYALRFIRGRGSKLATLSKKYGNPREVDILSRLAHADARALFLLSDPERTRGTGEIRESEFNIFPSVNREYAASLLYIVSYEAVQVAVATCEVFEMGLEIPPWISGELKRLGDQGSR